MCPGTAQVQPREPEPVAGVAEQRSPDEELIEPGFAESYLGAAVEIRSDNPQRTAELAKIVGTPVVTQQIAEIALEGPVVVY